MKYTEHVFSGTFLIEAETSEDEKILRNEYIGSLNISKYKIQEYINCQIVSGYVQGGYGCRWYIYNLNKSSINDVKRYFTCKKLLN